MATVQPRRGDSSFQAAHADMPRPASGADEVPHAQLTAHTSIHRSHRAADPSRGGLCSKYAVHDDSDYESSVSDGSSSSSTVLSCFSDDNAGNCDTDARHVPRRRSNVGRKRLRSTTSQPRTRTHSNARQRTCNIDGCTRTFRCDRDLIAHQDGPSHLAIPYYCPLTAEHCPRAPCPKAQGGSGDPSWVAKLFRATCVSIMQATPLRLRVWTCPGMALWHSETRARTLQSGLHRLLLPPHSMVAVASMAASVHSVVTGN